MIKSYVIGVIADAVQMNFVNLFLKAFNGAAYIFAAHHQVSNVQA